jgi:integrase/recombinase XerD
MDGSHKTTGKRFFMTKSGQAKILTEAQVRASLAAVTTPTDRLMILLSVRAGLRACEIANLTWPMVTTEGGISPLIALPNRATKGKSGGREIPMHADIREALEQMSSRDGHVLKDARGRRITPNTIAARFSRLYRSLGFTGCSSHSGRRTFITRAARKIVEAGGTIRDVQQLAGHASLSVTQLYIEGDAEAKRKVIGLI